MGLGGGGRPGRLVLKFGGVLVVPLWIFRGDFFLGVFERFWGEFVEFWSEFGGFCWSQVDFGVILWNFGVNLGDFGDF